MNPHHEYDSQLGAAFAVGFVAGIALSVCVGGILALAVYL